MFRASSKGVEIAPDGRALVDYILAAATLVVLFSALAALSDPFRSGFLPYKVYAHYSDLRSARDFSNRPALPALRWTCR